MHSPILQLLFASLAAVNLANGLPQEAPEGDDTQDVNLYGTPFPVFVDQFQDLNVLEDPINIPLDDGSVTLSCIDCKARAGIVVNLTLEEDTSITDSLVNVAFYNTAAHIELGLVAQGGGKAFLPIWPSDLSSSSGVSFEIGIALEIEGDIDVRAGFDVVIPHGTYFNYIPSSGLQDTNLVLSDDTFQLIPLHVESGSATFKAALQARLTLGLDLDTPLIDAQAELGAYINFPEIVYNVHSTETCGLEMTSFANIGFGLWAEGDVSVGWEDDEGVEEGEGKTLAITPVTIGETATDCLVGQPTSFLVGGAPPPTSEPPVTPTTFKISGAPPITLSATTTTLKPLHTVSETFETGYANISASASGQGSLTSSGSLVVAAPASQYTTSTVYTTMVYTTVSCAASVTNCPAKSAQTVIVTEMVELYTTVCPVADTEAVPTHIAPVSASVDIPDKMEPLVTPASQPPVLEEAGPNYNRDRKSNASEITLTNGSYRTTHTPSIVPVTAGALSYKDLSGFGGFGGFLAVAACLMTL
ncbi:glycoside hydrolase family 18 protein [Fusarium flagelliforme]|uniref:Glycoside hydrolase family 18 protein n=1 Tax=Fusarium flagelliforme TaxID=2675880 RepID=A0A395MKF7_9HYPO|nr:glycoside hydrolase family 18 protein [Fusarium flagelliforme]